MCVCARLQWGVICWQTLHLALDVFSFQFPKGCTNHSRIRLNIYFQKQLYMFRRDFDWTPGGHVVDRCLDDLMFEVMLILDGASPLNQLLLPPIFFCLCLWHFEAPVPHIWCVLWLTLKNSHLLFFFFIPSLTDICPRMGLGMAWLKWAMIALKDGLLNRTHVSFVLYTSILQQEQDLSSVQLVCQPRKHERECIVSLIDLPVSCDIIFSDFLLMFL